MKKVNERGDTIIKLDRKENKIDNKNKKKDDKTHRKFNSYLEAYWKFRLKTGNVNEQKNAAINLIDGYEFSKDKEIIDFLINNLESVDSSVKELMILNLLNLDLEEEHIEKILNSVVNFDDKLLASNYLIKIYSNGSESIKKKVMEILKENRCFFPDIIFGEFEKMVREEEKKRISEEYESKLKEMEEKYKERMNKIEKKYRKILIMESAIRNTFYPILITATISFALTLGSAYLFISSEKSRRYMYASEARMRSLINKLTNIHMTLLNIKEETKKIKDFYGEFIDEINERLEEVNEIFPEFEKSKERIINIENKIKNIERNLGEKIEQLEKNLGEKTQDEKESKKQPKQPKEEKNKIREKIEQLLEKIMKKRQR